MSWVDVSRLRLRNPTRNRKELPAMGRPNPSSTQPGRGSEAAGSSAHALAPGGAEMSTCACAYVNPCECTRVCEWLCTGLCVHVHICTCVGGMHIYAHMKCTHIYAHVCLEHTCILWVYGYVYEHVCGCVCTDVCVQHVNTQVCSRMPACGSMHVRVCAHGYAHKCPVQFTQLCACVCSMHGYVSVCMWLHQRRHAHKCVRVIVCMHSHMGMRVHICVCAHIPHVQGSSSGRQVPIHQDRGRLWSTRARHARCEPRFHFSTRGLGLSVPWLYGPSCTNPSLPVPLITGGRKGN